jgi:hypothetical protein
MMRTPPMMFPAPPPDGGFLVLNDAQLSNLDLLCAIKTVYPSTKIYAQRALPSAVHRVMSIGNAPPGPTGMVGYFAREADLTLREIRSAVAKMKSATS